MNNKFFQTRRRLEVREINQEAIFKANRLMVQDLLVLDHEKVNINFVLKFSLL